MAASSASTGIGHAGVGVEEGVGVGPEVGVAVGTREGAGVGKEVGCSRVGITVGACVGAGVALPFDAPVAGRVQVGCAVGIVDEAVALAGTGAIESAPVDGADWAV